MSWQFRDTSIRIVSKLDTIPNLSDPNPNPNPDLSGIQAKIQAFNPKGERIADEYGSRGYVASQGPVRGLLYTTRRSESAKALSLRTPVVSTLP